MVGLGILAGLLLAGAVILGKGELASHALGWPLFIAAITFGFVWQFGRRGAGSLSPALELLGTFGAMIVWILLFILVGWKGGVAAILGGFGGGFVGVLFMGVIRGRIEL